MSLATSTSSLSTFHSVSSSRNPITLRLRKTLGTVFTDPTTTECLQTLSHIYSTPADVTNETAARVRKNLQRDLENKLAEGSQHFLKAFGEVNQVCRLAFPRIHPAFISSRRPETG